jgi:hypothetical protein
MQFLRTIRPHSIYVAIGCEGGVIAVHSTLETCDSITDRPTIEPRNNSRNKSPCPFVLHSNRTRCILLPMVWQ